MGTEARFHELVASLAHLRRAAGGVLPPLPPDGAGTLRQGLERAVLSAPHLDQFLEIFLRSRELGPIPDEPLQPGHLDTIMSRGLDGLNDAALAAMATTPGWVIELNEHMDRPSAAWLEASERLYWTDAVGPRYPAGFLLAAPGAMPSAILRDLIRREVEDALGLAPSLPNARLARWAFDRLCGPDPLPDPHRRVFLGMTAEVIRDVREASAARACQSDPTGDRSTRVSRPTLVGHANAASLDTIASQASEEALVLADASRYLDAHRPELGEVFRLAFYAGQSEDAIATLLGLPAARVADILDDARGLVLAHVGYDADETPDTTAQQPPERVDRHAGRTRRFPPQLILL